MKDVAGLFGLVLVTLGLAFVSVPYAVVASGGILVLWAVIEDIKNDR